MRVDRKISKQSIGSYQLRELLVFIKHSLELVLLHQTRQAPLKQVSSSQSVASADGSISLPTETLSSIETSRGVLFGKDERYHAGIALTKVLGSLTLTRYIRRNTWIGAMLAAMWPASGIFTRSSRNRIPHRNTPFSSVPNNRVSYQRSRSTCNGKLL